MRILHVIGKLDRGGAETWLVQVLRHIDRQKYQMDFLVHGTSPGAYDEEVRALGSRIIPCLSHSNPMLYARNFRRMLREYGPYDVVHSHVHHFSGFVMLLGAVAKVPVRIVHGHTTKTIQQPSTTLKRKLYDRLMLELIAQFSTKGMAVSRDAADGLFPTNWARNSKWSIAPIGIDLKPYRGAVSRSDVRTELGLADGNIAVAHVGRFEEEKNHRFLVEIAAELCSLEPRVRFFLVGDGALRPAIQDEVKSRGLARHVRFLGIRKDVPRLLRGAADLFVFPSLYEGFGLAHVEAQLAGIPSVVSDVVPGEADVIPELVLRLSLTKSAARWAGDILAVALLSSERHVPDLRSVETTISIEASARRLADCYSQSVA